MIVKNIYKELIVVDGIKEYEAADVIRTLNELYNDAVNVEYHEKEDDFWVSVDKYHSDTDWINVDSIDKLAEVCHGKQTGQK
jgi:hypothetical protein